MMRRDKNERNWKKKRKTKTYNVNTKFYIFTEGTKTERYYFNGFKKYIEKKPRLMNVVQIIPCGKETVRILEDAITYKKNEKITDGEFWCVYDVDDNPKDHVNSVVQKCDSLNRNKEKNDSCLFKVAWSNECFEIWFLLHFMFYTSNNHRRDYYRTLDNIFEKNGLIKYEKNMESIFDILLEIGNPKLAIKYAKKLIIQSGNNMPSEIAPGTNVYELVEELIEFLPEEIKKYFK